MASAVLEVALISDATRFSQGFRKAEGEVKSFDKTVQKAQTGSLSKLDSKIKSVGVSVGSLGVAFGVQQLIGAANTAVKSFSELEQSVGGVESVFGDVSNKIQAFARRAAQSAGLSESAFNNAATRIGGMLQNLGLGVDEAADKTVDLIQIGADLAATYGGTVQEAVDAIAAALRGETDPIERFAVSVKQADVNARAMALGLAESTTEVDKQAKAAATLDLIYEQTAKAQGQFAREADTLAGKTAIATAEMENNRAKVGQTLQSVYKAGLPIVAGFAQALGNVAEAWLLLTGEVTKADQALAHLQETLDVDAGPVDVLSELISSLERDFSNGAQGAAAYGEALFGVFTSGEFTIDQLEAFRDLLPQVIREQELSTEKTEASTAAIERALAVEQQRQTDAQRGLGVTRAAAEAQDDLSGAIGDTGEAAEDAEEPTAAMARALGEIHKRGRDAILSMAGLREEFLKAADPAFAAVDAVGNYQAAQAALDEVQKDRESTDQDVALAQLAVAETALEAQAALDGLAGGDLDAGLQAIATALGISTEEAAELLAVLDVLDGKTVNTIVLTTFKVDGKSFASDARGTIGSGSGGSGFPGRSSGDRTYSGRASGGPVGKDQPYIVGEDGPEMFVPNQSGRIIPHGQSFGGNSLNVVVNNPEPRAAQSDIQRELLLAGVGRWAEVNG